MRNKLTMNVVALNYGVTPWVWYPTTIAYEGIAHNGCLLIWDEKRKELVEHRPADAGTAEYCIAAAARLNELSQAARTKVGV